jgi:hypothetical protein
MGAVRRLHRVATFQRVSVRYVFRIAFGREADRISGGGAMVARLARNAGAMMHRRIRPDRPRIEPKVPPLIEDTRPRDIADD